MPATQPPSPTKFSRAARPGPAPQRASAAPSLRVRQAGKAGQSVRARRLAGSFRPVPGLAVVAALLVAVAAPARADVSVVEGVEFPAIVESEGLRMDLHATGVFRWRIFFKPYVAALYLTDPGDAGNVLADVPKRLELSYFYEIAGPDFGKAAETLLARNLGQAELRDLAPAIRDMHALYRDVKPGDRYALTYVPERGTELALNGTPLGVVPGAEFASAYFGIWLGEVPLDDSLKQQLLARR